jgi:magnesium-dependent phosphatase 1
MLAVFDLDFTLWDCGGTWCDCTEPPYTKTGNIVLDSQKREIYLYQDVFEVLNMLQYLNIPMAIASRTEAPEQAKKLIKMFGIDHYFKYKEIYPTSKIQHFKQIQQRSGLAFSQMYFFDDEYRNISEVMKLSVNCLLVNKGLKMNEVKRIMNLN